MGTGSMLQGDSISTSHHRHMPLSELMSWRPEPTLKSPVPHPQG